IQRQRLAEEVRVRAEVVREIALDVRELPIERENEVDRPGQTIVDRGIREKVQCPEPRQRAKAELEHACPVDADERRVGVEPARELFDHRRAIAAIAGQPPRATELFPVLVAIQLPDDLVVAAARIEMVNRAGWFDKWALTARCASSQRSAASALRASSRSPPSDASAGSRSRRSHHEPDTRVRRRSAAIRPAAAPRWASSGKVIRARRASMIVSYVRESAAAACAAGAGRTPRYTCSHLPRTFGQVHSSHRARP